MSHAELYQTLLGKTPFIRPWMEPFLPENVYLRDTLIGAVVAIICALVTMTFALIFEHFLSEKNAFYISLVPLGLTLAFGLGPIQSRYLVATMKFRRIRNGK